MSKARRTAWHLMAAGMILVLGAFAGQTVLAPAPLAADTHTCPYTTCVSGGTECAPTTTRIICQFWGEDPALCDTTPCGQSCGEPGGECMT